MDSRSCGGMAQADFATYNDTLGVVRIVRSTCRRGLPVGLAGALVNAQLLARIVLRVCGVPVQLGRRAWDSLTGTRALGRWPAEMAARAVLGHRPQAGWAADLVERANTCAMAIYLDNLYTFVDSACAAVALMRGW